MECIGIGAPAVGPLATALKNENAGVRSKAAEALGAIGDAHAAEPLIDTLRDNVNNVRKAATEALGKIGPSAMESLLPALQDKNSCVRRGAVEALGKIGDGRAVDPLIAVLNDEDKEVRERTIRVLGNIGAVQAVGPLIAGLQDRDPEVRRAAIEALVGLYKAGQLDEACKKLILTHSSEITSPHEDSYTCIGRHEGHTDIKIVRAAVSFPLRGYPFCILSAPIQKTAAAFFPSMRIPAVKRSETKGLILDDAKPSCHRSHRRPRRRENHADQ